MPEALYDLLKIVLSSLVGALIALLIAKRRRNFENTISLHKEFSSGDLLKARNKAEKVLKKFPLTSYLDFKDSITDEDRDQLWIVIHFYQRLYISIKHNEVRKDLIIDLFGEVFVSWWYLPFFERSFVLIDWTSCKRLKSLYQWFEANSEIADFNKWRGNGSDFLKEIIDMREIK